MFQGKPREHAGWSWLAFAGWCLFILLLAPLARPLIRDLVAATSRSILVYITIGVTCLAAGVAIRWNLRKYGRDAWPRLLMLGLTVGAYAAFSLFLMESPQDALHFIEYGFLGLLAFRALSQHHQDSAVYLAAVLMCGLIGIYDEFLQWVHPERVWDLRDAGWNVLGAALAQIAIAAGMKPPFIATKPARKTLRLVCSLGAVAVAMLMICFANTPAAVAWYASRCPLLEPLARNSNVMTEYGLAHHDPDGVTFKSRFTLEELKGLDAARATDAGAILAESRKRKAYGEFLSTYTPAVDPFVREVGVRLFRRDHYHLASFKHEAKDPDLFSYHMTVAFRENQILERYVSNTVRAAGAAWGEWERQQTGSNADLKKPYDSPVGDHLITSVSEVQMQSIFAVSAITLLVLRRRLRREPHV